LLNHLLVYSLVQTEFLVSYVSVWQSMLSQIVVSLIEMMSSESICLFWLRYESYACGGLLNVLYSLMPILAHGHLLVILLWTPYVDLLLFCKSWHGDRYNCSNTCLYAL
jgi:hypothetical protein